jgi:predicted secreted Zn-dependent protease
MAGTKVKVKIAWGKKEKKLSIKIGAKTLGGALKELLRLDEWGDFHGDIAYVYRADANNHVTEVTLKPSYTIQMPTWAGYSKAPKACQQEWSRMWKKLEEHENGHRDIHLKALTAIQNALAKKTDLTVDQLESDFARMMKEAQDKQDKFDNSTGHGSNKGVELNITKECE